MNIREYISGGMVESCVLGLASAEERSEFEQMCKQYPEIAEARLSFELILEEQAMQMAVTVPDEVRQQVMKIVLDPPGKAVPVRQAPVKRINWLRYAVAACIVLLAGSLYWNIALYNQNSRLQHNYTNTVARLENIEEEVRMISQNPAVKMAAMKGMEASPSSYATVYWDTLSKDVYLLVNNLPRPPGEKQYQFWALLDGRPLDMGMIDNQFFIGQNQLLLRMKNVSNAQAFAITLERKGGNPLPEGDMYVMGKL